MKVYSVAASVISIFAISTAYFVEKGLAASDHLAPEQQRTDFIKNVRQDALISQIHWFIGVTDVELINEGLDRCKSFREGTPLSFYYHLAFQQAVPFSSGLPGITPQRELIVSRRSLEHLCPDQAFKLKYPRALTTKVLDPGSDKFFNSLWNPQESASSAQQQEYVKQIRSDLITMKVSMSPAFLGEKSLISFAEKMCKQLRTGISLNGAADEMRRTFSNNENQVSYGIISLSNSVRYLCTDQAYKLSYPSAR